MRHVVKYLLVLAILMSGFYMARKFRAPEDAYKDATPPVELTAASPAFAHENVGTLPVKSQLPVAALVDVDKTPTRGAAESGQFGKPQPVDEIGLGADQQTLKKQPTVKAPPKAKRPRGVDGQSDRENGAADQRPRSEDHADGEPERAAAKPDSNPSYDDPLPDFADQYQPWLDPLDETEGPQRSERVAARRVAERGQTASDQQPRQATAGPQRHEIVVGDTLELLAEKYLGDRQRHREIYEANRDQLFHPRLLPIGVEIVIPGAMETAMAAGPDPFDTATDASEARVESGGLEEE